MEQLRESKKLEARVDFNSNVDVSVMETTSTDEKDDEEEDEEKEENMIVEKSHNNRFIKRNKRLPTQISGVDNTFIAIEPKSGKEILWHERILSENKNEREGRFLTIAKKLKRQSHPFLIWRRHVGQLLSVLNYLHRLGITHGNLKKEDIYYQSSGILKVGPFMLDTFFGQKTHPSDIYAFGILALEIAVWTLAIDSQASTEEEKVKLMLSQLTDPQQRSFIEACIDPNPTNRPKIKALLNHPAVTEVPSLRLLSAKVVVSSLKPQPPQEEPATNTSANATEGAANTITASGKTENLSVFVQLMDDFVGHLEDDTAIVEIVIPAEQVTKVRVWKDFRTMFSSIPKYLDDVK
ncbi:unnamed protein product [Rodentolepis nana]|uniref:Protein kinase domain-containing protein n=1 Tax=Rodentolepis nana TaxID=102285 RepID=A0A0R3TM79_RODNA|nr:unnamed protein product [Rodentolepis nana]